MVTPQEKAQCVSRFIETKSNVQTQQRYTTTYKTSIHVQTPRRYRIKYVKDPLSCSSIRHWRTTKRLSYTPLFSADVLGRPLLTTSNTDLVSINFLSHRRIKERDSGFFTYLTVVLLTRIHIVPSLEE